MIRKHLFLFTCLFLLILSQTSCKLLERSAKKSFDRAEKETPFDAIIVPGYPFKNGTWSSLIRARVMWSYLLYKNGYTKNVIYSGAANYTAYKESVIMGLYAEQLGIPKEHIFYDTLAKHSTENVYYGYLIAKRHGFKKVALATDGLQSIFLKNFMNKHLGTPLYMLPMIKDSVDAYKALNPLINAERAATARFVSIQGNESFFNRIFKPGRSIDWSKYKDERLPAL